MKLKKYMRFQKNIKSIGLLKEKVIEFVVETIYSTALTVKTVVIMKDSIDKNKGQSRRLKWCNWKYYSIHKCLQIMY